MSSFIFDRYYTDLSIRRVSIVAGKLTDDNSFQLNLFDDYNKVIEDDKLNAAIDEVKNKYGKNSILKASALLDDSTAIERNKKIGGHNA